MTIKRYLADKDNTITNAFQENLITRGTEANMGASDVLEVFSIYGQTFSSSSIEGLSRTQELSRILVQFPIDSISTDRSNGNLPASGNVNFYLRLFNAKHASTVPKGMNLSVVPVSSSWEEGFGLDMENYKDLTKNIEGSNWINRTGSTAWATPGGTYLTASANNDFGNREQVVNFPEGIEDLSLDITDTVERWIKGFGNDGFENYGLGIHLTASQEAYFSSSTGDFSNGVSLQNVSGAERSYYTKKFFSRTSEFFYKRPIVEARWDSTLKDDRGKAFYSSSLVSANDNLNTLYLYNVINGRLKNIPNLEDGSSKIYVQLFSGSSDNSAPSGSALQLVTTTDFTSVAVPTVVTGGWVSTGIYSASFALTAAATPIPNLYDVWYLDGGSQLGTQIFTGSFDPQVVKASAHNMINKYVVNISNLKPEYYTTEKTRFRITTRQKDWQPTIYSKAIAPVENMIVDNMYYKISRVFDDSTIIGYGTGSLIPEAIGSPTTTTRLSYDVSGSYFDLNMSLLEPGYMYGIELAYFEDPGYARLGRTFKFRVEEDQDS